MYTANSARYNDMPYRKCGKSGLRLPPVALGLWHNFGTQADDANCRDMICTAFDSGVTYFDLANNYGPLPGSAEARFGQIIKADLAPYRDEIIVATKAGYEMYDGPYGDGGSRKYLLASCDASLKRMGLDYVDIFYHHRRDTDTPLEETMGALAHLVHSGKALYVGISNYNAADTRRAAEILAQLGVPCLINQFSYSMLNRANEEVLEMCGALGMGSAAFCPLAQGILTGKYRNGIPADSRAASASIFLTENNLTPDVIQKVNRLEDFAHQRGQSIAQMALAWALRAQMGLTTVIIGASRPAQITENLGAVQNLAFTQAELDEIEAILA